ncbi:cysteine repeat modular protein 2-like [Ranitomeya variabilis]|uniref:cysteine repeat modular protein 2-like n=1 Tax=Ranitomeya variabilis TaxID=490064 RepID=UPI0040568279
MELKKSTVYSSMLLLLQVCGLLSAMMCPNGQFALNAQCVNCHSNCEECSGQEPYECTQCGMDQDGIERFLHRSRCKVHCPRGFYPERETYSCDSCLLNCDICSNANSCQKCKSNYKLQHGECYLIQCLPGQMEDPDTGECVDCETGCKTCEVDDPEICLSCLQGYYLYHLQCRKHCPSKTYEDNGGKLCLACASGCIECHNETHCSSCQSGYYLHDAKCVTKCPGGMFQDKKKWQCEACHKSCMTCHGLSPQDCDLCPEGKQPSFGMCYFVTCSDEQFLNVADSKCYACDQSCQSCFGPQAQDCFSCHSGYYLDEENQCVQTCPQGFFGDPFTQTCEKCSVTCESCAGSSENCLKCNTKEENLFLHEGRCVPDCLEGYYENLEGSCETCEGSCWTCEGNKGNCLSCVDGLYLENNKCLQNCSVRYYPDEEGICKHCPAHCTVCADERTCLECSYLYLLYNGTCKASCPNGYYEDLDAGRCVSCHISCETCSGTSDDDCETCPSANPKLYQGKCLTSCPPATFYNYALSECQECHKTCAKCSGPQPTDCTKCQSQLTLDQESEMCGVQGNAQCPPKTFLEDDLFTCSSCDQTCESCDGRSAENCVTCLVPYYLYKSTCVKQCPTGTYNTSEEADGITLGFCSACHQVCTTCHGGSAKDCDLCASGYYKLLHLCILHCPPGYYKRNNQCDKCDSRCQLCSGPGLDSCLECPPGIFQVEGTTHCVSKCPERFYIHGNKCKKCHPSCRTCNDSSVQGCKTCDRGSSFKAGICYPQCEEHRYLDDDSVCQPCDPSCRHCSGPGSDHCISCNSKTAWSPEEMRCINCCDSEADQNDCCFCDVNSVLCIKHLQLEAEQVSLKNLKFPASSTVSLSPHFSAVAPVLVSLLLIIAVALLSIWGVKSKKMLCWKQSYERLADSPQDVSCQDEDCKQEYEEDEENLGECDVVYSTKDGTVYKKLPFKIHTAESGLLNNEDCMNKV